MQAVLNAKVICDGAVLVGGSAHRTRTEGTPAGSRESQQQFNHGIEARDLYPSGCLQPFPHPRMGQGETHRCLAQQVRFEAFLGSA